MAGRTHLLSRLIGYYALHGVIVLFVADEPVGILCALGLVFETVTFLKTYEKMGNWLYIIGGIQHLMAVHIGCKIHIDIDYKMQYGSFGLDGMGTMYLICSPGVYEGRGCIFVCCGQCTMHNL